MWYADVVSYTGQVDVSVLVRESLWNVSAAAPDSLISQRRPLQEERCRKFTTHTCTRKITTRQTVWWLPGYQSPQEAGECCELLLKGGFMQPTEGFMNVHEKNMLHVFPCISSFPSPLALINYPFSSIPSACTNKINKLSTNYFPLVTF